MNNVRNDAERAYAYEWAFGILPPINAGAS